MSRAELKAYYIRCDQARMLREPEFRTDLFQVKRKLASKLPHDVIFMKCFNDVDVEIIKDGLTEDELKVVKFSWLYTIQEEKSA